MAKKKTNFKWNVWIWDINHDKLEQYDVVPRFLDWIKDLPKKERPKTRDELDEVLDHAASYNFWAKCEYEMIIHSWPVFKNDEKVDVYDQLKMNWDVFVDFFWDHYGK